jgi:predicted Zn finger-like uncharacterized protein
MTVQCPRCRTQYKIPTTRLNDPRPVFKCTRCSLVFSSEPERAARGGKTAKEDKNLPLPFASRKDSSSRAKPPLDEVDEDAPTIHTARDDRDAARLEEDEPEESAEEEEDEQAADGADEDEEESADEAEAEEDSEDDAGEDESEDGEPDEEPAKPARRPSRARRTRPADDGDDAGEPAFARAERDRAAVERERAAERERERLADEKEKARVAAEKERARLAAEKERERQRAAAEREKERARLAAEKERARATEARRRERDELRRREEEDEEIGDDGPADFGDDEDDDEPRRPVLSASASKQRRAPINPRRGIRSAAAATPSRSPMRPVAIGVALVAAVYGIAALWLSSSSEAAIATLGKVPVLGSLLGGDHLLVWRLQLADVDGALDQIKGGRPAYVVSGRAVNTSNEDLRVIEIEGRLLVNGVEQRRQTVYAANQQRKTIQDLSPSEVEMLLRLEPNRRFSIRPGESASFLLVFPNPPPGTTEVTCRVVDARNS